MRLPRVVYSGEVVEVDIEVTEEKQTKVEFIDVTIRGRQGWAGTRTFPVRFTLPPETAPSHELR